MEYVCCTLCKLCCRKLKGIEEPVPILYKCTRSYPLPTGIFKATNLWYGSKDWNP